MILEHSAGKDKTPYLTLLNEHEGGIERTAAEIIRLQAKLSSMQVFQRTLNDLIAKFGGSEKAAAALETMSKEQCSGCLALMPVFKGLAVCNVCRQAVKVEAYEQDVL
jgi:hypothetical protein